MALDMYGLAGVANPLIKAADNRGWRVVIGVFHAVRPRARYLLRERRAVPDALPINDLACSRISPRRGEIDTSDKNRNASGEGHPRALFGFGAGGGNAGHRRFQIQRARPDYLAPRWEI